MWETEISQSSTAGVLKLFAGVPLNENQRLQYTANISSHSDKKYLKLARLDDRGDDYYNLKQQMHTNILYSQ